MDTTHKMAPHSSQDVFQEFIEFCHDMLASEDPKFLALIKSRYNKCAEEFRQSEAMTVLLRETKHKMCTEKSRLFVHLKTFLTLLKSRRKAKKRSQDKKKEENGRDSVSLEIRNCSIVLENCQQLIPVPLKSESTISPDGDSEANRSSKKMCHITDGQLQCADSIAFANEAQMKRLLVEFMGLSRSAGESAKGLDSLTTNKVVSEVDSDNLDSFGSSSLAIDPLSHCDSVGEVYNQQNSKRIKISKPTAEKVYDDIDSVCSNILVKRVVVDNKSVETKHIPKEIEFTCDTIKFGGSRRTLSNFSNKLSDSKEENCKNCLSSQSNRHHNLECNTNHQYRKKRIISKTVTIKVCNTADSIIVPLNSNKEPLSGQNQCRVSLKHVIGYDHLSHNTSIMNDKSFKQNNVLKNRMNDPSHAAMSEDVKSYTSFLPGTENVDDVKDQAAAQEQPHEAMFKESEKQRSESIHRDNDKERSESFPNEKDKERSDKGASEIMLEEKDKESCDIIPMECDIESCESISKDKDNTNENTLEESGGELCEISSRDSENEACETILMENDKKTSSSFDIGMTSECNQPDEESVKKKKKNYDSTAVSPITTDKINADVLERNDDSLSVALAMEADSFQDENSAEKTLTVHFQNSYETNDTEQSEESVKSVSVPNESPQSLTDSDQGKESIAVKTKTKESFEDKSKGEETSDICEDDSLTFKPLDRPSPKSNTKRLPFVLLTKINANSTRTKSTFMDSLALQPKPSQVTHLSDNKKNSEKTSPSRLDAFYSAVSQPSTSKEDSDLSEKNLSENEFETESKRLVIPSNKPTLADKTDSHVKKLEQFLEKLRDEIEKCQNRELSLDDLDAEDSQYIYEDRLKKKFVACWTKLCQLTKRTVATGRPTEKTVRYEGTRYREINRRLEKFLNKYKIFPDFHDVKAIVRHANKKYKLNLSQNKVDAIAREAFVDIGNMLQRRRQEDFIATFESCHKGNPIQGPDPAFFDPVLKQKLDANTKVAKSNLENVIEKFTQLQYTRPTDKESDSDEDEEEEEEEEEDHLRTEKKYVSSKTKKTKLLDSEDDEDENQENNMEPMDKEMDDLSVFPIEVDIASDDSVTILNKNDTSRTTKSAETSKSGTPHTNVIDDDDVECQSNSPDNDFDSEMDSEKDSKESLMSCDDDDDDESQLSSDEKDRNKEEEDFDVQIIENDSVDNDSIQSSLLRSPMSIDSPDSFKMDTGLKKSELNCEQKADEIGEPEKTHSRIDSEKLNHVESRASDRSTPGSEWRDSSVPNEAEGSGTKEVSLGNKTSSLQGFRVSPCEGSKTSISECRLDDGPRISASFSINTSSMPEGKLLGDDRASHSMLELEKESTSCAQEGSHEGYNKGDNSDVIEIDDTCSEPKKKENVGKNVESTSCDKLSESRTKPPLNVEEIETIQSPVVIDVEEEQENVAEKAGPVNNAITKNNMPDGTDNAICVILDVRTDIEHSSRKNVGQSNVISASPFDSKAASGIADSQVEKKKDETVSEKITKSSNGKENSASSDKTAPMPSSTQQGSPDLAIAVDGTGNDTCGVLLVENKQTGEKVDLEYRQKSSPETLTAIIDVEVIVGQTDKDKSAGQDREMLDLDQDNGLKIKMHSCSETDKSYSEKKKNTEDMDTDRSNHSSPSTEQDGKRKSTEKYADEILQSASRISVVIDSDSETDKGIVTVLSQSSEEMEKRDETKSGEKEKESQSKREKFVQSSVLEEGESKSMEGQASEKQEKENTSKKEINDVEDVEELGTGSDHETNKDEEEEIFSSIRKLCETITSGNNQEDSCSKSDQSDENKTGSKDHSEDDSNMEVPPESENTVDESDQRKSCEGEVSEVVNEKSEDATTSNEGGSGLNGDVEEDKSVSRKAEKSEESNTAEENISENLKEKKLISKEEARDEVGLLLEEARRLRCKKNSQMSHGNESDSDSQPARNSCGDDDIEITHIDLPVHRGRPPMGSHSSPRAKSESLMARENGRCQRVNVHTAHRGTSQPYVSRSSQIKPRYTPTSSAVPGSRLPMPSNNITPVTQPSESGINWSHIRASIHPEIKNIKSNRRPQNPMSLNMATHKQISFGGQAAVSHTSHSQNYTTSRSGKIYPMKTFGQPSSVQSLGPRVPIPTLHQSTKSFVPLSSSSIGASHRKTVLPTPMRRAPKILPIPFNTRNPPTNQPSLHNRSKALSFRPKPLPSKTVKKDDPVMVLDDSDEEETTKQPSPSSLTGKSRISVYHGKGQPDLKRKAGPSENLVNTPLSKKSKTDSESTIVLSDSD